MHWLRTRDAVKVSLSTVITFPEAARRITLCSSSTASATARLCTAHHCLPLHFASIHSIASDWSSDAIACRARLLMIRNELTMQSASRTSSDSESGSFSNSTTGLFHPRDSDLICDRKETASSPCVKTTARVSRGFEEARKKSSISQSFSTGSPYRGFCCPPRSGRRCTHRPAAMSCLGPEHHGRADNVVRPNLQRLLRERAGTSRRDTNER